MAVWYQVFRRFFLIGDVASLNVHLFFTLLPHGNTPPQATRTGKGPSNISSHPSVCGLSRAKYTRRNRPPQSRKEYETWCHRLLVVAQETKSGVAHPISFTPIQCNRGSMPSLFSANPQTAIRRACDPVGCWSHADHILHFHR